jgi:hypothetical protein
MFNHNTISFPTHSAEFLLGCVVRVCMPPNGSANYWRRVCHFSSVHRTSSYQVSFWVSTNLVHRLQLTAVLELRLVWIAHAYLMPVAQGGVALLRASLGESLNEAVIGVKVSFMHESLQGKHQSSAGVMAYRIRSTSTSACPRSQPYRFPCLQTRTQTINIRFLWDCGPHWCCLFQK